MFHAINVHMCGTPELCEKYTPTQTVLNLNNHHFRLFVSCVNYDEFVWWENINVMIFIYSNDDERKYMMDYIKMYSNRISNTSVICINENHELHAYEECKECGISYFTNQNIEDWHNVISATVRAQCIDALVQLEDERCCLIC